MTETLICERCGGDNPVDARFCIDCGATLAAATTGPTTRLAGITCRSCNANNPENARFCVVCGRSVGATSAPEPRPQPQPQQQPARPQQRPHAAPRPTPRYNYPRMATPPTLTPMRPQPRQFRPSRSRRNEPGAAIFLIGLVVLLANHTLWPGILVLIGFSILANQLARGRADQGMRAMLWLGGITLLLATGTFWPGIFLLLFLSAAIGGWGRGGFW